MMWVDNILNLKFLAKKWGKNLKYDAKYHKKSKRAQKNSNRLLLTHNILHMLLLFIED